ncbi:MAG: DinB family protein [Bacteroidota bacterium]
MPQETSNWILEFKKTIEQASPVLMRIPISKQSRRSAPDKWSPKEIIGHLIDSATNNHRRFVKAQWQDQLMMDGYEQENWVKHQCYQEADWKNLVTLWHHYNLHLVHVMQTSSAEQLNHVVLGLRQGYLKPPIPADQPCSLRELMQDYIAHLKHHLTQILQQIQ